MLTKRNRTPLLLLPFTPPHLLLPAPHTMLLRLAPVQCPHHMSCSIAPLAATLAERRGSRTPRPHTPRPPRPARRLALEQHATLTERNRVELRRLHLEREADTRRMVALFARTQAALVQASAAAWAECAAQFEAAA